MARRHKRFGTPTLASRGDPTYEHILELLGCGKFEDCPNHPLRLALAANGLDTTHGLLTIPRQHLASLSFVESDGIVSRLVLGHQNLLLVAPGFRMFFEQRESCIMTTTDWLDVTAEDFFAYRLDTAFEAYLNEVTLCPAPAAATSTPAVQEDSPRAASTTNSTTTKTPVDIIKQSIVKRDPLSFIAFTDPCLWASWNQQFVATACEQDLHHILDRRYVPPNAYFEAVFLAQNKYLYSVFVLNLLTEEGKALVIKYAQDFDAQSIYAALVDHHAPPTSYEFCASSVSHHTITSGVTTTTTTSTSALSNPTQFPPLAVLCDHQEPGTGVVPASNDVVLSRSTDHAVPYEICEPAPAAGHSPGHNYQVALLNDDVVPGGLDGEDIRAFRFLDTTLDHSVVSGGLEEEDTCACAVLPLEIVAASAYFVGGNKKGPPFYSVHTALTGAPLGYCEDHDDLPHLAGIFMGYDFAASRPPAEPPDDAQRNVFSLLVLTTSHDGGVAVCRRTSPDVHNCPQVDSTSRDAFARPFPHLTSLFNGEPTRTISIQSSVVTDGSDKTENPPHLVGKESGEDIELDATLFLMEQVVDYASEEDLVGTTFSKMVKPEKGVTGVWTEKVTVIDIMIPLFTIQAIQSWVVVGYVDCAEQQLVVVAGVYPSATTIILAFPNPDVPLVTLCNTAAVVMSCYDDAKLVMHCQYTAGQHDHPGVTQSMSPMAARWWQSEIALTVRTAGNTNAARPSPTFGHVGYGHTVRPPEGSQKPLRDHRSCWLHTRYKRLGHSVTMYSCISQGRVLTQQISLKIAGVVLSLLGICRMVVLVYVDDEPIHKPDDTSKDNQTHTTQSLQCS